MFLSQYLQKTPIHNCGPGHYWRNCSIMKLHFGFDTRTNVILRLNTAFAICLQWHLLFVVNILGKLRNLKLYSTPSVKSQGLLRDQYFVTVIPTDVWSVLFSFLFFTFSPSIPAELWKHRVMQENFSVVRPQIVETFVQRLMENYQESDTEVHILHFCWRDN